MTANISERRTSSNRARPELIAALAVLAVAAAYLPALRGEFFGDDYFYVANNTVLQRLPLAGAWRIFVQRTNPWEYLPLRDLSYRVDIALFGNRPFGYHLHNLLLYVLSCGAAFLAARGVSRVFTWGQGTGEATAGAESGPWFAVLVTALFAAHPAHVESVAWISGRKEVLSGLFALLALWQFASGLCGESLRWRQLAAACGLFLAAVLSKTTVLPLCAVACVLAAARYSRVRPPGRGLGQAVLAAAPLLVVAAAATILAVAVAGETGVRLNPAQVILPEIGPYRNALRILGYLGRIAAAPVQLRLIYDIGAPGPAGVLAELLGGLLLVAAAAGGYAAWRRRSVAGFGAATFVLFSLPFLQLVPFRTWSAVSERFLFMPVLGLSIAVAAALARLRPRLHLAAAAALALLGLALTAHRSTEWASALELVETNARRSPSDWLSAGMIIESVLLPSRRYDEARTLAAGVRAGKDILALYVDSRQAFEEGRSADAVAVLPELDARVFRDVALPGLLWWVGRLHEERGDDFDAARYYLFAGQEIDDKTSPLGLQFGEALERIQRRYSGQLADLRARAGAEPGNLGVRAELGNLAMEVGLLDEAAAIYRAILREAPDLAEAHYNLGMILSRQEELDEAAAEFRAAIANGMTAALVWNDLGVAYKDIGDVERAEDAFHQALAVDPRHYYAAFNLGRMYARRGQDDRAREAMLQARERAVAAGEPTTAIDAALKELAE